MVLQKQQRKLGNILETIITVTCSCIIIILLYCIRINTKISYLANLLSSNNLLRQVLFWRNP